MESYDTEPHAPNWKVDTRTGDKPDWVDIEDNELHKIFEGAYHYCEDGEIDNLDWDRMNFEVYGEDYYRDKFGEGFPDEYYKLMADSTKPENKIQDYRSHPLKIEKKEVIVTMS